MRDAGSPYALLRVPRQRSLLALVTMVVVIELIAIFFASVGYNGYVTMKSPWHLAAMAMALLLQAPVVRRIWKFVALMGEDARLITAHESVPPQLQSDRQLFEALLAKRRATQDTINRVRHADFRRLEAACGRQLPKLLIDTEAVLVLRSPRNTGSDGLRLFRPLRPRVVGLLLSSWLVALVVLIAIANALGASAASATHLIVPLALAGAAATVLVAFPGGTVAISNRAAVLKTKFSSPRGVDLHDARVVITRVRTPVLRGLAERAVCWVIPASGRGFQLCVTNPEALPWWPEISKAIQSFSRSTENQPG